MDQEQILQEFVDSAAWGQEFLAEGDGYFLVFTNDLSEIVRKRRPEFLKERVAEILPRREEWTTRSLCEALGCRYNRSEATSIAKIVHELGWQSRQCGGKRLTHFRKSFSAKGHPGSQPLTGDPLKKLQRVIKRGDAWCPGDLCDALKLPRTNRNLSVLGVTMKSLGWTRKRDKHTSRKQTSRAAFYVRPS
jgi:hypothetical protein